MTVRQKGRPPVPFSVRRDVLAESGGFCVYCGQPAEGLDHIFPFVFENTHRKENLVASCGLCNSIAGSLHFATFADKVNYVRKRRSEMKMPVLHDYEVSPTKAIKSRKVANAIPPAPRPPRRKVHRQPGPYSELIPQAPGALRSLIADLGYAIEVKPEGGYAVATETLEQLATELSVFAGKDPHWKWRYLHGVLNGKQLASPRLTQAIFDRGAVVDGAPAILANTQEVTVRARQDQLHPGSVVLAASKRCANPTCRVAFVPVVPWQKSCSAACRIAAGRVVVQAVGK